MCSFEGEIPPEYEYSFNRLQQAHMDYYVNVGERVGTILACIDTSQIGMGLACGLPLAVILQSGIVSKSGWTRQATFNGVT